MNPHTLSASAQRALEGARAEAIRLEHDAIGAEHIVLALLGAEGPGTPVLQRLGLHADRVRQRLEAGGRRGRPRGGTDELAYTSHAKRLIEMASKEARETGTGLSADHLLLAALLEPRGPMGKMLAEAGAGPDQVRAVLTEATGGHRTASVAATATPRTPVPGRNPPGPKSGDARPSRTPAPHLSPKQSARSIPWRPVLLLAVPVSIALGLLHAPPVWVFITACLGVLPLAGYMGEATEHLAHRTGPTIGGLLNATFGNAAELIIAIVRAARSDWWSS